MRLTTKTVSLATAALLLSSPFALAQTSPGGADGSAGTSLSGTSNGKQGAPSAQTTGTMTGKSSSTGTSMGSTGASTSPAAAGKGEQKIDQPK